MLKMRERLSIDPHDKSPKSDEEELNFELLNEVHKLGGEYAEKKEPQEEIIFLEDLNEAVV